MNTKQVAVKVSTTAGAIAAVLDTACFSIWVDKGYFVTAGGYDFVAGGSAASADGGALKVAGGGRLDFCLWGRRFVGQDVRGMDQLPATILIGRQFMELHSMSLELGRGLGSLRAETSGGRVTFSGSIRLQVKKAGGEPENVHGVGESRKLVAASDTEDAIRHLNLDGFGTVGDQAKLREVLVEHIDVFCPNTGVVPGEEFRIVLRPEADLSKLNRPAFRKSPTERAIEDAEVKKLLDRGILEPSISPCGTSNVLVPKKDLPDGTPGGMRITADLRAVNSVTIGDAFPTEDVGRIVDWLAQREWFSAVDLRDGYWNVLLAEDSRPYTALKKGLGLV
jgi:hypothetical protein